MPSLPRKVSAAVAACARCEVPSMPSLLRKVSTAAADCARRDAPSMPSLIRKVSIAAAACARRDAPSMPRLVRKTSTAAAAGSRRVSRATRRLLRARRPRRDFSQLVPTDDQQDAGEEGGGEEEGGLWRRTVLMGERCKPLDFPGAIHYDSNGRLLPAARSPRGGKAAGALLCRSATACDVDEAATARSKGRLAKHV